MTPKEIAFAHEQLRGPLCGSVCQNGALAIATLLAENTTLKEQVAQLEAELEDYRMQSGLMGDA